MSPVVGRISDRRGRLVPIRFGLVAGAVFLVAIPIPESAAVVAVLFVCVVLANGSFWAPAMALLSDEVERARVQQGYAFAFTNIAWSAGVLVGNGGGGAVAEATADWVSYAVVAVLFVVTFATLTRRPQKNAPAAAASVSATPSHDGPPPSGVDPAEGSSEASSTGA